MPAAPTQDSIRVFVSYSRADAAFADELVLGLGACGFSAYIDREDIAAGEDWARRLTGLISEADTVVHVLSPDSLTSEACRWERAEALRMSKRLLPVVWRPVPDAAAPPELKRLNYIFFTGEGHSFASGLAQLAEALRTDIDWIREHTRLAALAERWSARNRSDALLLRGEELDAARAWENRRPPTAPAITDAQADFIKASHDARVEADRRARRARAGLLITVSVVAVAMTGLAGFAGLQWMAARENLSRAEAAAAAETAARRQVEAASLRLNARIGLRTAPKDDGYFVIGEGWYPVAANYSGAIARLERSGGGQPASVSSGFVIDGGLVHPRYAGEALLLTPAGRGGGIATSDIGGPNGAHPDTLGPSAPSQPQMNDPNRPRDTLAADADPGPQRMVRTDGGDTGPLRIRLSFPAVAPTTMIEASDKVWATPDYMGGVYPFELWRLSSTLPAGARALAQGEVDCTGFDVTPPGHVVGSFSVDANTSASPVLQLGVSELLDRTDPYAMRYTHASNIASYGAPVFDLTTGGVFAIHIGSEPYPDHPGRRRGYGTSLRLIIDMARQQMADAEGHLPPICGD